jgi:hypothetical protein
MLLFSGMLLIWAILSFFIILNCRLKYLSCSSMPLDHISWSGMLLRSYRRLDPKKKKKTLRLANPYFLPPAKGRSKCSFKVVLFDMEIRISCLLETQHTSFFQVPVKDSAYSKNLFVNANRAQGGFGVSIVRFAVSALYPPGLGRLWESTPNSTYRILNLNRIELTVRSDSIVYTFMAAMKILVPCRKNNFQLSQPLSLNMRMLLVTSIERQ